MLALNNIVKNYYVGNETVQALKGVSMYFRESEFVSILGQSGCGKTTLLNIIGGLDRYTTGDLVINGKSTKDFKDGDWDTYRNHSVGFVFQSYNLIPHQTVLANVELALTLSGVSKKERHQRAKDALEKVGLGNQIRKRPNQMSGGQMQRVAIARALVNDPDILLADEPTGALDSATSVQIMDLLREISKDKLIIMVTHNADLAKEYSSRIIQLKDGEVIDDSNPFNKDELVKLEEEKKKVKEVKVEKKDKTSMSFWTALSLSFNNLMTKKARTILTSFAGSIGIIGIALILALSQGFQNYIDRVQEDTLSAYPIAIEKTTADFSVMLGTMAEAVEGVEHPVDDKVYSNSALIAMMDTYSSSTVTTNNLKAFKSYVEMHRKDLEKYTSSITYSYGLDLQVYSPETIDGVTKVNPSFILSTLVDSMVGGGSLESMATMVGGQILNVFCEIMPGVDGSYVSPMIENQYEVICGEWPDQENEIVLIVNSKNEISDLTLYALGLKSQSEFLDFVNKWAKNESVEFELDSWTFDEIMQTEYSLVLPSDHYEPNGDGTWSYIGDDATKMRKVIQEKSQTLVISGIIRPSKNAAATGLNGSIGYTNALMLSYIERINNSDIVKAQIASPNKDILSGKSFPKFDDETKTAQMVSIMEYVDTLTSDEKAAFYTLWRQTPTKEYIDEQMKTMLDMLKTEEGLQAMRDEMVKMYVSIGASEEDAIKKVGEFTDEELVELAIPMMEETIIANYKKQADTYLNILPTSVKSALLDAKVTGLREDSDAEVAFAYEVYKNYRQNSDERIPSYSSNLKNFGYIDLDNPKSINFYPISFEDKDNINAFIEEYNNSVTIEDDKISYTDIMGTLLDGITIVINAISYILIGFVSISLIVSSIMIGIITYISVLERTKEIGVLRAIGASKRDISRVFNAETLIVGLISGLMGIGLSLLLCIPITAIVQYFTGMSALAMDLPLVASIILIIISMVLTLVAGLIPSRLAAKKDPVEALRSE